MWWRGGPDRRPRAASGTAGVRTDEDDAGRRRAAVARRRVQPREHLDGEDVGGGHLLQDLELLDRYVVENHAHLIFLIDARAAAPLDASRLTADLTELHVRHRQPERVPGRLGTGLGDRFGGDHPPGARGIP